MENRPDDEKESDPQTGLVEATVEEEIEETTESQRPKGVLAMFREAFDRARRGQRRGSPAGPDTAALVSDRTARNRDRTRILFVSIAGLVAVLVIFLGVFSSSRSTVKREPAARRNPSLGQPESAERRASSVTPLLNAETNGRDPGDGQLTADDINNTARPRGGDEGAFSDNIAWSGGTGERRRGSSTNLAQRLEAVPFTDPALEVYRQRMTDSAGARPPAAPVAAAPVAPPQSAASESETLAKSSLIYVRAKASSASPSAEKSQLLPATEEAVLRDRKVWSGLPAGTRLVARLETAVSTAVNSVLPV